MLPFGAALFFYASPAEQNPIFGIVYIVHIITHQEEGKMFETISVIGGDMRQLTLLEELKKDGADVLLYGFDKENTTDLSCEKNIDDALLADIIILPVPVSFDGETLNMPFGSEKLTVRELIEKINPLSIVFGGRIHKTMADEFNKRKIAFRDYMTREELAVRNAIPTAEGAIEIAMSETPVTLHGSKCLVLGYGKIGKILSSMLLGIGAQTYVEARKYADLAMIEGHGGRALPLSELKRRIHEFDIIFNTVPAMILPEEVLKNVNKNALIIDLASKPGGVDFDAAKQIGLKVIWALSLPGKVAPVTSGKIIKDTIMNILTEMGV